MTKLIESALTIAGKYPVFPCNADKQPIVAGGFKAATRDRDEVKRLFSLPGAVHVGVPTGHVSGLMVVDIDPAGAEWLEVQRFLLPRTREHSTKRGTHLLFAMPEGPVSCSTNKIAPGVDVRADGGYIIWWPAAGCSYKAEELTPAPADIVEAARSHPLGNLDRSSDADDPLSLSKKEKAGLPIGVGEGLLSWVNPDCSYDDWFRIGMGLQHEYGEAGFPLWLAWSKRGKKFTSDDALAEKWASFGRFDGVPTTLRYLIKLANKAQAAVAEPAAASATGPFRIVDALELMRVPPPGWIVRDLIPQGELGMLFAQSGAGKTFFTLDLALHIATGTPWRGKRTKQQRVLYICAEGSGGFGLRFNAALQANAELDAAVRASVFKVLPGTPNFLDNAAVDALIGQALALGGFDFVVVDTVAQVTPGGNENAGEDMGRMIGNARKFNSTFGAFVLLLHHPGKDETKGARGWSGVRGALDVELEIVRNGDDRVVRVTKQKDGTEGERYAFRLTPQAVEGVVDADGFPVSSCRVEVSDLPKNDKKPSRYGDNEAIVIKEAADLAGAMGGTFSLEVLIGKVRNRIVPTEAKKDDRRKQAKRAISTLQGKGELVINGELVELVQ